MPQAPLQIKYDYTSVPTIQRFAGSKAFIRGLMGPFGSGKSTGCVMEIIRKSMAQKSSPSGLRKSRWVVVRNTAPQLVDTTIKTFHQWVPPEHFGRYWESDHTYLIKGVQGCEIEVMFRALDRPDHIRNLLSLEVTGAWVNEAREVPWGIIEALQGRVGRYPSMAEGGVSWSGIIMDTNPPDVDSKWYKFFEEPEAWDPPIPKGVAEIFKQPSGLSPQAENLQNLPSAEYYKRLAIGKTPEWKKVYIDGQYGFVVDGKPVYPEYNDRAHCHEAQPIKGVQIYRSWDFGLCYDDQTEVLTSKGWKLFKDVNEKCDLAASRDPLTGEFCYSPIAFKIAKEYHGEMLEWDSTELNLCVTPEHVVPFTYRDSPKKVHWKSAQWLSEHMSGHHYLDLRSVWGGWQPDKLISGMEPMIFAEFMGIYLSEGSSDGRRISIYQKRCHPEMVRILDATGLKWKRTETGKAAGWHCWAPWLAGSLKTLGTAKFKYVPQAIRCLPSQHIRAFIMAYTLGDGHVRKRKNGSMEHTLFTTSKRMADDMQELAQKAGWNSSLSVRKPQTSILDGRKIVNGGGYSICFKKTATRAELLKRNFKRVPYDGMVYCLNVPHHTLYVRRKGKPSWNGNTPACIFSQVLPNGRWLVFDEIVSEETMGADRFSDEVITFSGEHYPHADFKDIGDPAGESRAQTDERTCFSILQAKGIDIEGGEQNITIRLESVRKPLRSMVTGEPQFILHPRCSVLRKGFLGAYKFRRMQTSNERYTSKPDKDRYSHPHDALQYAATRIFGSALTNMAHHLQEDFGSLAHRDDGPSDVGRSSYTGY